MWGNGWNYGHDLQMQMDVWIDIFVISVILCSRDITGRSGYCNHRKSGRAPGDVFTITILRCRFTTHSPRLMPDQDERLTYLAHLRSLVSEQPELGDNPTRAAEHQAEPYSKAE